MSRLDEDLAEGMAAHEGYDQAQAEEIAALKARIAELEAEGGGEVDPNPPDGGDDGLTVIGMSSPSDQWDQRLEEVGPDGITARRIFISQLKAGADDQMDLANDAAEAGMTPVVSFKVANVSEAKKGTYDSWVAQLRDNLTAITSSAIVVCHHEPYGDLSGPDFVALNQRYAPILKESAAISFGCFLNGWLLDNKQAEFTSFTSDQLLAEGWGWGWDFMGIDTYESGEMDDPGNIKPADRGPKLVDWLTDQGHPDKPIGIGEYNGYSAETIAEAGEMWLSLPTVAFACMWNATEGKGYALEGERLGAFQITKADPRVVQ
jgi:hypothetical protein